MRPTRRLSSAILIFAFLGSALLMAPAAQALALYRPATQWGHTYAAPALATKASVKASQAPAKGANLEKTTKFSVKYTNFPDWAKTDVQAAIDVWAANFPSDVVINVEASYGRSASYGVLGSARPGGYFSAFKGAPDATLWYPSALANALAGKDLDTVNPEIVIQVNSNANWDRRNDGAPTSTEYDMQSVILHELGHGLGFLSTDSYDSFFGMGSIEEPTPFDAYLQTSDGYRLSDLPSPSLELGKALVSTLVWSGAKGVAANKGVKPLIYTPSRYEDGSSISHLDEATFSQSALDAVMTPNLNAGEIFHQPGPLLLAMMEDMRLKPPAGIPTSIPLGVRNAQALVGDSSAMITFDPPSNARAAQISSYTVKNLKTGTEKSISTGPLVISGLKNGTSYTFAITAINTLGTSEPVETPAVTPQAGWKRTIIDAAAEAKHLATTTFNGAPVIAYTDGIGKGLKLATYKGGKWTKVTVDGNGGTGGRTNHDIDGDISLCVNGLGTRQTLHIFYVDSSDKDLRYAAYNGKTFKFEIVDGNGASVNNYENPIRVRTSSDVSLTNACVASSAGVQVFYRDETQGILLGAIKQPDIGTWEYELVDGDRKTNGRTTGDVGFHLDAIFDGKNTYVMYDSVLTINQKKEATSGAVRIAKRPDLDPDSWSYQTLDISSAEVAVAGYGVSLSKTTKGIAATWFTSAPTTTPHANQIRWALVTSSPTILTSTTVGYGAPTSALVSDGKTALFNCQERLCALDLTKKDAQRSQNAIYLVSNDRSPEEINSAWIVLDKVRYVVAGVAGKLTLLKG